MFVRGMLVANPFSKKHGSDDRKPRRDHAEDPNHNIDVETMRKLRMYQRRTYLNQEQSRRRSLRRHNNPTALDDGGNPSRPSSAPTTAIDHHRRSNSCNNYRLKVPGNRCNDPNNENHPQDSCNYRQRSFSDFQSPGNRCDNRNNDNHPQRFISRLRVYSEKPSSTNIVEFCACPTSATSVKAATNSTDESAVVTSSKKMVTLIKSGEITTDHIDDDVVGKSAETGMKFGEIIVNQCDKAVTKHGEGCTKSGELIVNSIAIGETGDTCIKPDKIIVNQCDETVAKHGEGCTKSGELIINPTGETFSKTNKESFAGEPSEKVAVTAAKTKLKNASRKSSTKSSKKRKYLLSCIS